MIELSVKGAAVAGTITRTNAPNQTPTTLKGKFANNVVTFSVTSPDGMRTISMTGKVSGDEIVFERKAVGTAAGAGAGTGFYGLSGPKTVSAKRLR